jgi:hypothetical protein
VTASPPAGAAREAGSPSAAAYRTNATAINDVNSPRKVTTLIDRLVVWVFMVQSSIFPSNSSAGESMLQQRRCRHAHSTRSQRLKLRSGAAR